MKRAVPGGLGVAACTIASLGVSLIVSLGACGGGGGGPPDAPTADAYVAPPFTNGVSTLTGAGDYGDVDGDRNTARFWNPVNVAVGPDGDIYVADFSNGAIRRSDPAGNVDTVYLDAKTFQRPFGLAFAPDGTFYVSTDNDDTGAHTDLSGTIWRIDTTAKTATVVVRGIGRARGLASLPDGRLVMSDYLHNTISLLDPTNAQVTLIAGAMNVADHVNGSGADARFDVPYGMAVIGGATPMIVVADYGNHRLREVALDGTTSDLAGTGTAAWMDGDGGTAELDHPEGVAADASGMLYVTDTDNFRVRRVVTNATATTVDTLAGNGTGGYVDDDDSLSAELYGLEGVASTSDGSKVYIADGSRGDDTLPYNRVRVVDVAH